MSMHTRNMSIPQRFAAAGLVLVPLALAAGGALALGALSMSDAEWSQWRGPWQNGVSPATGLISSWSVDGDNQIWRADLTGRSTPVVFRGRVCANGRAGEGVEMRETAACWSAADGSLLWERSFNVHNTTVPFSRVGWGSVAADEETGYLFVHTVDGVLAALDESGETVWQIRLHEDYGRASGYGGRTNTPVIDEDRVILPVIGLSWGPYGPPRNRFYAFDKRDGRIVWTSNPSTENPKDMNTQSVPVIAEIEGRRMMIGGGADGWLYALDSRTGVMIWKYLLSKRGINASVVVSGTTVYASHSEENVDTGTQGRVVAIDATGSGDVTGSHERWRVDSLGVGFASPLLHAGRLYLLDNSANLIALDAADGEHLWEQNVGTVGKSSPVWADGKIWITEVNGNFVILEPHDDGATVLDTEHIEMPDGRYAEIYGSPAVAYGRVYFTTENGLFALGDATSSLDLPTAAAPVSRGIAPAGAEAAYLQVVPADSVIRSGEELLFEVRAYDALGRLIGPAPATLALQGIGGRLTDGVFVADPTAGSQAGHVVATAHGLEGRARVRVAGPLPLSEDFSSGVKPGYWIGAGRFNAGELDGEPVLHKPPAASGLNRSVIYVAPDDTSGVTVQIDLLGTRQGRRRPDGGVVNSGYTLDLQGNHQRIEVRSWASELRMAQRVPFEWEMDTWYTAKLRVDQEGDHAIVRGKVWPRDEPEPDDWTITAEDPMPIRHGAPGIYGYSPVDLYFDNFKVTVSE